MKEPINGGYFIVARKIEDSAIAHTPPHIREIWLWLLRNAYHTERTICSRKFNRGQLFTSYDEIREGLHWTVGYRKEMYTKSQTETAMKWITKHGMATTARTARGIVVTVCNYDTYQDLKRYENRSGTGTRTTGVSAREPHAQESKLESIIKEEMLGASAPEPTKVYTKWDRADFIQSMQPKKEEYPTDMLNNFFRYWSEADAKGKMRFQKEKTWETNLRLANWHSRDQQRHA